MVWTLPAPLRAAVVLPAVAPLLNGGVVGFGPVREAVAAAAGIAEDDPRYLHVGELSREGNKGAFVDVAEGFTELSCSFHGALGWYLKRASLSKYGQKTHKHPDGMAQDTT